MVFMVALMRGEMDEILGMKLLDTDSGKTIKANKDRVTFAIETNQLFVENIRVENGLLKAFGGAFSKYTSYYNSEEKQEIRKSIIIIAPTEKEDILLCADNTGQLQNISIREIVRKQSRISVANANIDGNTIIFGDGTTRTLKLTEDEVDIRNSIKRYAAKCRLTGSQIPKVIIEDDEVKLVEVITDFENYIVPPFITAIKDIERIRSGVDRCINTKSIEIPSNVKSIGRGAFYNFSHVEIIDMSQTKIEKLEEFAFYGCKKLKKVILPNTLKTIGKSAFHNCTSLENMVLPYGLERLDECAFYNCKSLKKIVLPSTVKHVGNYAFSYCESLENIIIPEGSEFIGEESFSYCKSLRGVSLPESLTVIRNKVFKACTSLRSIRIPSRILHIDADVFELCEMNIIEIPRGVEIYLKEYIEKVRVY